MRTFIPIMLAAVLTSHALAQDRAVLPPAEPKTQLEELAAKTGTVVVRGYSIVGSIRGLKNTSADVAAKEFTDTSSGKKVYGIAITVTDMTGDTKREHISYIDYDELDSLLKALDYFTRIDKSVTRLDDFQAEYRTKGDMTISTFRDSDGLVQAAVESGLEVPVRAYLPLEALADLKTMVTAAKAKLDAIKQ